MSQRDTLVPLCKIVGVGANSLLGNIKLPYTGHWVESVITSGLSLSAVIGAQPSSIAGNGLNRNGLFQDLTFVVSAATTTTPLGVNWAEGYIRVGQSDGALSPAGDVLPILKNVLTKPGSYNENILLGTTTGGSKVIMPDFSGLQLTSMSLAGSAGNGVSWFLILQAASGDADTSANYFNKGPNWLTSALDWTVRTDVDYTQAFPSGTAPIDFQDGYNLSDATDALGKPVRTSFYFGQDFGSPGEIDTSLQIFTSAGGDQTVPGNNPATLSPNGVSSTITVTDQGANRIVQFTPGNYTLDTSFGVSAGPLEPMSQNPMQMVLSSLAGDVSAVFNITSGNTGVIFTTKISDAVAQPNYVTVTDLSGAAGYFRVAPSSGPGYYVSAMAGLTPTSQTSSGIPGSINLYGGTAVLSMMGGVKEIDIENQLGAAASLFAINYGVIKQSNTTGDGMHPDVK